MAGPVILLWQSEGTQSLIVVKMAQDFYSLSGSQEPPVKSKEVGPNGHRPLSILRKC